MWDTDQTKYFDISMYVICPWKGNSCWWNVIVSRCNNTPDLFHTLCVCLPQTAPQTWTTTLKRTMTATRQSRKPVTMQFTARSVLTSASLLWMNMWLYCLNVNIMQRHFDIEISDLLSILLCIPGSLWWRRWGQEAQETPEENDPNHLHDSS